MAVYTVETCKCGLKGQPNQGDAEVFCEQKKRDQGEPYWEALECPVGALWHCYDEEKLSREFFIANIKDGSALKRIEASKKRQEQKMKETRETLFELAPSPAQKACEDKLGRYPDKETAMLVLNHMKDKGVIVRSLYSCSVCNAYHLTSQEPAKRRDTVFSIPREDDNSLDIDRIFEKETDLFVGLSLTTNKGKNPNGGDTLRYCLIYPSEYEQVIKSLQEAMKR